MLKSLCYPDLFKSAQAYRPVFVAARRFHIMGRRSLCSVCGKHRGRSKKLCSLCNEKRAYPGCVPERCWVAFQGDDGGHHHGACKDCFATFLMQNLDQRLSMQTVMRVVDFL